MSEETEITKANDGLQPTHQPFFETHQSINIDQNGKLVQFLIESEKAGYSNATTKTRLKILRLMNKNNVNLANPEDVKLFIARRKEWSSGHKCYNWIEAE